MAWWRAKRSSTLTIWRAGWSGRVVGGRTSHYNASLQAFADGEGRTRAAMDRRSAAATNLRVRSARWWSQGRRRSNARWSERRRTPRSVGVRLDFSAFVTTLWDCERSAGGHQRLKRLRRRMSLSPLLPLLFFAFEVAPAAINRPTPFSHGSDLLSRYPLVNARFADSKLRGGCVTFQMKFLVALVGALSFHF